MALRGILANWLLAGAVIAGFGLVSTLGPRTPIDETPRDSESESAASNEVSNPETEPIAPVTPPFPIEEAEGPSEPVGDTEPLAPTRPQPPATLLRTLSLCGSMSVSNRPAAREDLQIINYQQTVTVNGVNVAVAPVEEACFSSGFGPRGSSLHKGIDLHNSQPVQVFAGATGTVKEKQYRDDYGNMLVLDHGNGVYTQYAHLESFADGLIFAETVTAGEPIGIMGNTASYSIPRHLHYEVMTGEWGALSGSFGLTAINIMAELPEN